MGLRVRVPFAPALSQPRTGPTTSRSCWTAHNEFADRHHRASPTALRDPIGVHGVFVNGVQVFDGKDYTSLDKGPGQVLDRFLPARAATLASAAQ